MKQKKFGVIGILIPFLFLIGMLIYYALFNFQALLKINSDPLILYAMDGFPGSRWMAYYNHVFIGIIMIAFTTFLLDKTDNSITNLIGKLFLLVSSLSWTAVGLITSVVKNDGDYIEVAMILTCLVVGCGALGFIVISSEFGKICFNNVVKKLILSFGIVIIAEAVVNMIFINNYPSIISKITWLMYFSGFGTIGYAIFIKPAHNSA